MSITDRFLALLKQHVTETVCEQDNMWDLCISEWTNVGVKLTKSSNVTNLNTYISNMTANLCFQHSVTELLNQFALANQFISVKWLIHWSKTIFWLTGIPCCDVRTSKNQHSHHEVWFSCQIFHHTSLKHSNTLWSPHTHVVSDLNLFTVWKRPFRPFLGHYFHDNKAHLPPFSLL